MTPVLSSRPMPRKDFSHANYFPGTTGNPFDVVLHVLDRIARLSDAAFAALLILISLLITRGDATTTVIQLTFFLGDWILLDLLPRFNKSFGPAKPPALMLAILRSPFALLPLTFNLPLQIIGTLLVVYGFWIEPHTIHVTHQTLRTPKLKPDQTIRILHLGDIHLERITNREKQLIELCRSLKPDLILYSGDFLNLSYLNDPIAQEQVREVIAQIDAPLGVYCVGGSPAVDLEDLVPSPLLDGAHWRFLKDEKIEIGDLGLEIVGLVCSHKPFIDSPKLQSLISNYQLPFTILLYHSPDLIYEPSDAGIDLQLSGHTHGGQVRLPFFGALFSGSLYGKEFEAGRYQVGGSTLYVSRGIGMEGAGAPRVRFLCPPEIILWEITAQQNSQTATYPLHSVGGAG
ncbi:MAG: metallophosphoesterase [Chloroflexi bacterium]|nr:metallophosphoesterase [Chloroflexota bacterium]